MNGILRVAVAIVLFIVIATCGVAWYAGMFDTVAMTREPRGPFHLVYREYRGSYSGIRFVMNSVYRYVRDTLHLQTSVGFSVFYDNPQSKEPDSLRSINGIILDSAVTVIPPHKIGIFERTDAVVGRFRLRSFFSYTTGGYKFYSELQRFLKEKNIEQTGPVMEMYDMNKRAIYFIAPVQRTTSPVPAFSGK